MSRRARTLATVAAAALLLALPGGAQAHFTADGSGGANATVATLPAPTITSATPGSASVRLEWSAVTAPGSGTVTYYVLRDGGVAGAACPSRASPRAVTSCTDTSVSNGRHDYTVVALWRSWSATSATASATVAHGPATQLVFTTAPSGATGGVAFTTQPVVTARDANGVTVTDYAGDVRLTIQSGGAAGAVLSGCGTALANGVTRFSGCTIDRSSGSAYTLRASDGTLSATSSITVNTGAAAQLVFTAQPSSATAGSEFSTRPVVRAADAGGNLIGSSYTGTVTLSIAPGTGTAGAVLSQCDASRSSGITTFDNCEINRSGSGYRLRASDGTLTGDSPAFNVVAGSVSQLIFTTQPGGSPTGGSAFPTQPVVVAADSLGNTVTSYGDTVRLSIRSGTGTSGAVLSGCAGTLRSGVTTFIGCTIDRSGTGYQLRATDGDETEDSASFTVNAGPLARLAFSAQPTGAAAGAAFTTQPAVVGQDAIGNTVTTYAGSVTLSIVPGTGVEGAVLRSCVAGSPSSGVIRFSDCRIDEVGSGYRLRASDGTHTVDSSSFTVNGGAVARLDFTTQPGGTATGGTAFTTQPVVTAYDSFGNVANLYSGTVTLSILSGTGTAGASLTQCSRTLLNGVSSFRTCEINRVGERYRLRASDGTRSATSDEFDVTAGPAVSLDVTPASTTQVAGSTNALTISLLDAGDNVATGYTGTREIVFGGANRSPSGASPTVTDSSGTAIAFGSDTTIAFTAGVASVSGGANGAMVLRQVDNDVDLNIDDGPLDNDGDEPSINVTVGTAARLAWTAVNAGTVSSPCFFTCTKSSASDGGTFQARVLLTDSEGNTISGIGSGRRVTVATVGSGGSFTSPTSGSSVSLTFASSGAAITTSSFTFRFSSGSWTTNAFRADSVAPDAFAAATATINNN